MSEWRALADEQERRETDLIDDSLRKAGSVRTLTEVEEGRWFLAFDLDSDVWDSRIVLLPDDVTVACVVSEWPSRHHHECIVTLEPGQTLGLRLGPDR